MKELTKEYLIDWIDRPVSNEDLNTIDVILQLQNNWNLLKEWLEEYRKNKDILVPVSIVKVKIQEIESRK